MGETGILDGTEERVSIQSVVTTATEKGRCDETISSVSNVSSKMSCNRKSRATKNLPNADINKKTFAKTDLFRAEKWITNPEKALSHLEPENENDKETGADQNK